MVGYGSINNYLENSIQYFMITKKTTLSTFLFFIAFFLFNLPASAGNGVVLYTPYTNISVPPGESINYSIDVKIMEAK